MQKRNIAHDFYRPDEPIVVFKCDYCGAEIYEGETCYEFPYISEYHHICENCITEVMRNLFDDLDFTDRLETVGGTTKIAGQEEGL